MGGFSFDDNVYAVSVEGDTSTGEIYFPKEDYATSMSGCRILRPTASS